MKENLHQKMVKLFENNIDRWLHGRVDLLRLVIILSALITETF